MSSAQLATDLPGTPFPEGEYTIEGWAQLVLAAIMDVPEPADGTAHPLFAYIATQCGIGIGVDGILALGQATAADGPMLASTDIELRRPLRVGESYRVTGGVVGFESKQGRRTGPFDLLRFELKLFGADDDEPASIVTNVFVLPRRSSDGA
jgi:hypothetical protein